MYEITITDDTMSYTMPPLEVGFKDDPVSMSTSVVTLSNDTYKDKFPTKRLYSGTYSTLSKDEYDTIFGFWYRQEEVTLKYPRITIPGLNVTNLVCEMSLSGRNIIDECGNVTNVSFSFRESKQNPSL